MATAKEGTGDALLGALLADLQNRDAAKVARPDLSTRKPDELKQEVLSGLRKAMVLAEQKASADEKQGFGQWLYSVAVNVAEASKEGGFLGMGGVRVSDEEKAALIELAGIFGVNA